MKSLTEKGTRQRIPMNLIQKQAYAYNPTLCEDVRSSSSNSTYFELRNIETEDGISQKLFEVDYPITADYVKSFENGANYKNDINQAVANGHNNPNLGDISAIQELLALDTSVMQEKLNKLKSLKAQAQTQTQMQAQSKAQAQSQTQAQNVKKDGE